MLKTRLFLFVILTFISATTAYADVSDYSKEHPLLFGIDMDDPPMEYIDEDGQPQGYDIEFTNKLMQRLGIPIAYSPNTWENISGDVLHGRVDLAMMVYSPYRKDSTNYSRAIFRLYYQIIYRRDSKSQFDVRHLGGKSIAYMSSRPIKDTLTRVGAQLCLVQDLSQAVRDLSEGSYDALICFRYQAKYFIEKYKLENLVTEDLTLAPREYCYVSHNRELIAIINSELEKMEAEGYIDAIYGEVYTSFGGIKIPTWIWYLLISLVFVFLVTFIILQQRYQKRLRKEMEHAQLSDRMKTVFLGNVSHALRTPLNAIIGFSDILKSEDDTMQPEERKHALELIHTNGRQLLYFINEILELSNIEGNELRLDRTKLYLREMMGEYAETVRPRLAQDVSLHVTGEDACLMADERLMRLVTMQFLENAVNHTKQGQIVLTYGVKDGQLRVEVSDTGTGVPQALIPNIFSLLADKATYIQDEVPGLGLTICKSVIDRCKGQIGLTTPPEGGSIFWYTVPVITVK